MFKWIVHIKKKAGMSREAFIDYYENHHLPLCRNLISMPPHIHNRNYLIFDDPMLQVDARGGAPKTQGMTCSQSKSSRRAMTQKH